MHACVWLTTAPPSSLTAADRGPTLSLFANEASKVAHKLLLLLENGRDFPQQDDHAHFYQVKLPGGKLEVAEQLHLLSLGGRLPQWGSGRVIVRAVQPAGLVQTHATSTQSRLCCGRRGLTSTGGCGMCGAWH